MLVFDPGLCWLQSLRPAGVTMMRGMHTGTCSKQKKLCNGVVRLGQLGIGSPSPGLVCWSLGDSSGCTACFMQLSTPLLEHSAVQCSPCSCTVDPIKMTG